MAIDKQGLRLAALCGFYPHQLGFCGSQKPAAKKIIEDYLSGKKVPEQKIRKTLATFEGAFRYYELIARSNNIKDPFDGRVVKAYWIGNSLLEKVPIEMLRKMITEKFSKKGLLSQEKAEKKAESIPKTSKPHHSFHVLVIGSVSGRINLRGKLLDFCRIGWGRVLKKLKTKNQKSKILVEYEPLQKTGKRYFLGKPIEKIFFWDKKFIPTLKIEDIVATHWNYVVQVLSEQDFNNLKKYTQLTLDSLKF